MEAKDRHRVTPCHRSHLRDLLGEGRGTQRLPLSKGGNGGEERRHLLFIRGYCTCTQGGYTTVGMYLGSW